MDSIERRTRLKLQQQQKQENDNIYQNVFFGVSGGMEQPQQHYVVLVLEWQYFFIGCDPGNNNDNNKLL